MAAKPRDQWGDALLHQKIVQHMYGVLFHLTDPAQALSIHEHGLLSNREASARGIYPGSPGGNALSRALDIERGVDDDVFLSFHRSVVMPKDNRRRRWLLLRIDPDVIYEPGVRVSLGRSTRSEIYPVMRAYHKMDWEIAYSSDQTKSEYPGKGRWIEFLNYEVLVPKCVPRRFIIGADEIDP
ncbi:DarT ssDNA thymidine ADP-ribosyltransferase family protein [Cupriavidus sp. AU9028]|uniref:DarT ssDNA thymidine ADP-ribosyltransferase family protein n=1 Tax=Cupriavidus sp. AU9028 TaxID=2871157 RepID=UPI001C941841|nr:DarT ssDNA thymidine ADP-ribosyltransferase family protein [Cupriavidus sp. AU9028]MBY4898704.1 DarT ssDNA thymidine ADP-ribosyltransferase family protein [Cupriavidus sp. AU9028]